MKSQNVACLRVSSIDQSLLRQQEAMKDVELDMVFQEKASAKDINRPKLQDCIGYCREGDILHVHSIDRIARNLKDLQGLVDQLIKKGVAVRFHKESLTFNGNNNPMDKLMLQMLGAFSEFERALIRERQREGIATARKAGKQFGRKKVLSDDQILEIKKKVAEGQTKSSLALEYDVSRTTLYSVLSN